MWPEGGDGAGAVLRGRVSARLYGHRGAHAGAGAARGGGAWPGRGRSSPARFAGEAAAAAGSTGGRGGWVRCDGGGAGWPSGGGRGLPAAALGTRGRGG